MNKGDSFLVGWVLGCLVATIIGMCINPAKSVREEAIKAGAAEYILVDPETGKTEFRWKTQ